MMSLEMENKAMMALVDGEMQDESQLPVLRAVLAMVLGRIARRRGETEEVHYTELARVHDRITTMWATDIEPHLHSSLQNQ